jgi:hypothetical protein
MKLKLIGKKFFRFFSKLILILGSLIFLGATLIWFYPKILINERTLNGVRPILYIFWDIDLRWDEVVLRARSVGFLRKNLSFSFSGLCVSGVDAFSACLDDFNGDLNFTFFDRENAVAVEIISLDAIGAEPILVTLNDEESLDDAPPRVVQTEPLAMIPNLGFLTIRKVLVDLSRVEVEVDDASYFLSFFLYFEESARRADLRLETEIRSHGEVHWFRAELDTDALPGDLDWNITGDLGYEGDDFALGARLRSCVISKGLLGCELNFTVNRGEVIFPVFLEVVQAERGAEIRIQEKTGAFTLDSTILHFNGVSGVRFFAQIENFQKVASWGETLGVLIPAPLNVLDGRVELRSLDEEMTQTGRLAMSIQTYLKKDLQSLYLNSELRLGQEGAWWFDGVIEDASLVLPRVSLVDPPTNPLPDPRIISPREEISQRSDHGVREELDVLFGVRLRTAPGASVELISNLLDRPASIQFDIERRPTEELEGWIEVLPFDIEILRQLGRFERFRMSVAEQLEDPWVEGVMSMERRGYHLQVRIMGPSSGPDVFFSSDPPLDRREILALLLFGRPPGVLAWEETEQVGRMDAALADGVLNLFSLYFLSAFPLERVHYDPATGEFTASVRLSEEIALDLGTDWEGLTSLGFQKRLGRGWFVTTDIHDPFLGNALGVTSFVEKILQY